MKILKRVIVGLAVMLVVVIGFAPSTAIAATADPPPQNSVIVHRGFGPEDTIPALRKASNKGADGWETDAHFTRDNVCIFNHDATLNRTTTGKGRVQDRSWRYVSHLRVRKRSYGRASHARVATCDQGLALCRDSQIRLCLIEAKQGARPHQVLSLAQHAVSIMGPALPKFIMETDTLRDTALVHANFPQVSVGFVGFNRWPNVAKVAQAGAQGIIVNRPVVSLARIVEATLHGLWVMPYTVETRQQLHHVRAIGVHGIMTDTSQLTRYGG